MIPDEIDGLIQARIYYQVEVERVPGFEGEIDNPFYEDKWSELDAAVDAIRKHRETCRANPPCLPQGGAVCSVQKVIEYRGTVMEDL